MKKFYALTMSLALGSLAFSASAADPTADPENNSTLAKYPSEIKLSWDGASLEANEDNTTDVEYGSIKVPYTIDGEPVYSIDPTTGAKEAGFFYAYIEEAEEEEEDDTQLIISVYPDLDLATIEKGYTLAFQFPANVVLIGADKTANDAVELTYTISANPNIIMSSATVEPASGSTLTTPSPVVVTFKGEVVGNNILVSYNNGENAYVEVNPVYSQEDDETTVSVNWAGLGYGNGSYTITLESRAFSNPDWTSFNQEQSFTYTASLTEMASEPEGYSQTDDTMYPAVFIIFDEPIDSFDGSNSVPGMLYAPDGYEVGLQYLYLTNNPNQDGDIATGDADNNFSSTYDALMLQIEPNWADIFGSGEYTIKIGPVVMNSNGEVNKPFEYQFQVIGVDKYSPVMSWDKNTNTINITGWENSDGEAVADLEVKVSGKYDYIYLNAYDEATQDNIEKLITSSMIEISGSNVVINLSSLELTEGLTYTMDMPEGFFTVGEGVNEWPYFSFTYEVSPDAINTIESVAAPAGVYNLQGVKVGNSLEGLSKGIYIINGKKVIIK